MQSVFFLAPFVQRFSFPSCAWPMSMGSIVKYAPAVEYKNPAVYSCCRPRSISGANAIAEKKALDSSLQHAQIGGLAWSGGGLIQGTVSPICLSDSGFHVPIVG